MISMDGTKGVKFLDEIFQPNANAGEGSLTQFYHPDAVSGYQDMYRSGWLPSWFNQQWGGTQWGMLPDGSFGSVATGQIEDNAIGNISSSAPVYYVSQGFKVSETATFDSAWLKLYKVGNPSVGLSVRIYTDSAGAPSTAIGTVAIILPRVVTSKTDGEWYQATGLAVALTAGTQYHIVCSTLTAVDASNYYVWKETSSKKYPHGYQNVGTSVPAWTPTTTISQCFLIQNPSANSIIQSSGMFDYKLAFNNGTPVNQSRSLAQPLANFYDGKLLTALYRGTYVASTNVLDYCYGLDHDRITVTINSSGYPVLTVYRSDRTAYTVTGTASITTGNHDVGVGVRTLGDGSDYAYLYVDGVSVGIPLTSQTFSMSKEFAKLGTARLGGGFGIIPTWTQDLQMTSLPSAQGWTWTGTATEANAMSIQGGKLYQNANGYTSTQNGYYTKVPTFSNSTGWAVSARVRVLYNINNGTLNTGTTTSESVVIHIDDGTKRMFLAINEYFVHLNCKTGSAAADFTVQGDFKSQDHVFLIQAKGSDLYVFIDGKLAIDATGAFTAATTTPLIIFGDLSSIASENADAIWSYVKYYEGGMILPTATSGTCSEFAHWSGDKSALLPSLWNGGTPVSVKQLCGVPRNYQYEQVVQREVRRGVTSGPTTTSTTPVLLADMECYVIGLTVTPAITATVSNSNIAQGVYLTSSVNGINQKSNALTANGAGYMNTITQGYNYNILLGLSKVEGRWNVNANTGSNLDTTRSLTVEARS